MSHGPEPLATPSQPDPGYVRVRDFLLFGLSLPERALRSASGAIAGTLRESASLLVPQAFRSSKTYSVLVQQMLDFLAEDVGGVERPQDADASSQVQGFVARKTVGNFLEMAALTTLHLSPMMLLAVVSDLAYGSRAYLKEVAGDLKRQGVIDQNSTIDGVDDLLGAVADAARTTAGTLDTPPLSLDGLKRTVEQTRTAVARIDPTKVIPQAELKRLWDEIHELATKQGVDPLAISGAVTLSCLGKIGSLGRGALSSVTAAVVLVDRHVFDHYRTALGTIREKGVYASLQETYRPYVAAVWKNFSRRKRTITERLFSGELIAQAWRAVRGRFGAGS